MLKTALKNKVIKNAGWLIFGRIYRMVLTFFVGLMTARYLGPDHFGLVNYAATYTTFFASLSSLGIGSIIVKNFVDYPDEQGTTLGTAIAMRAASGALSFLAVMGIVAVLDRGEPLTVLVVALSCTKMILEAFESIRSWFQARLQSKYSAAAVMVSFTLVCIYKAWLLITGRSVAWFAVSNSVEALTIALFLLAVYRKKQGPALGVSLSKAKQLLGSSYHFILSGLMVAIYGSTDKLMLKHLLSDAAVGYYSTAVSVCNVWVFVLAAVIESMEPVILRSFGESQQRFEQQNRQLYAIVFYISVIVSLGYTLLAGPMIRILYGSAYMQAAAPLRVITWYTAFSYLGVARNAWVICNQKQKYLKYLYLGASVTNVVLNTLLIPSFGAVGAAAASLVTQISTIAIFPVVLRDLRPNVRLMAEAIFLRGVFSSKG